MSDTTITPEKRKMFREDATFILAHEKKKLERIVAAEAIILLLNALEQAEARAETAGAEVARLKLKCGEAAPEGTEIFHVFGSEMVICPSCGEEIEEPWDEPGTDSDDDGNWHGVIECRGCDSKVEVHSQLIHFWTAKLADAESARRAVADSEVNNDRG